MKILLIDLKVPTCNKQVSAVVEQAEASFYPVRNQRYIKHLWPRDLDHCGESLVLDIMQEKELIRATKKNRKILSAHLWAILAKTERRPERLWDRVYSIFEWTRYASNNYDGVVTISKLIAKATIG